VNIRISAFVGIVLSFGPALAGAGFRRDSLGRVAGITVGCWLARGIRTNVLLDVGYATRSRLRIWSHQDRWAAEFDQLRPTIKAQAKYAQKR
jgi:hypothetical protein